MKKILVSQATGFVLNWMAAKADNQQLTKFHDHVLTIGKAMGWDNARIHAALEGVPNDWHVVNNTGGLVPIPPVSTDWAQGGPLISRLRLGYTTALNGDMIAIHPDTTPQRGEDHLVAGIRCFVAFHLGVEVEVPAELAGDCCQ